jgi:DNA-binding beta-propeller fold protein YncE
MRAPALALASVIVFGLLSALAALQPQQSPEDRRLAPGSTKGGEDETGPYEVVANWPQPWSKPGYIWGSQPGIFAESPNRVFIVERGEIKLPDTLGRGFNGVWGSTGERASVPKSDVRNCIVVVDGNGKMIESWTQWDHLFEGGTGPHKVKISPYDPERHVWVVNDSVHQIYKFSNDGRQLVMTLGERSVAGDDEKHFGQPQDLAFLPDGSIVIADGLRNSRVVKLDKDGAFIKAWGTKGSADGQFSGLHGIDADKNGRIYVADRGNHRIQIFDADGKHLDTWPNLPFPNSVVVTADQKQVWVVDGNTHRILQYDPNGMLLYHWGVYGPRPGEFWEMHQFSVDTDGNLYIADSFNGRSTKLKPRPAADKTKLVGQPLPLAKPTR